MITEIFEPRVVKSIKNISLIEISKDKFCVQKKSFFGGTEYFSLDIQGTGLTVPWLIDNSTVINDFERCNHIFNCNTVDL